MSNDQNEWDAIVNSDVTSDFCKKIREIHLTDSGPRWCNAFACMHLMVGPGGYWCANKDDRPIPDPNEEYWQARERFTGSTQAC